MLLKNGLVKIHLSKSNKIEKSKDKLNEDVPVEE